MITANGLSNPYDSTKLKKKLNYFVLGRQNIWKEVPKKISSNENSKIFENHQIWLPIHLSTHRATGFNKSSPEKWEKEKERIFRL